jgi:hypothetical protein
MRHKKSLEFPDADSIIKFLTFRINREYICEKLNLSPVRANLVLNDTKLMTIDEIIGISDLLNQQKIEIDPPSLVYGYLFGYCELTIKDLMKLCNARDLIIKNGKKYFKLILRKGISDYLRKECQNL